MSTPYGFRCATHGEFAMRLPMGTAGDARPCPTCGGPARRVWQISRVIIRPDGYNLKPGERRQSGLAFDDFSYELERGQLTDDATGAYTPDSRARREAELAAEDVYTPRPMAEIDKDIPPQAHQELHEWARAAYSQLEEARQRS